MHVQVSKCWDSWPPSPFISEDQLIELMTVRPALLNYCLISGVSFTVKVIELVALTY